MKADSNIKYSHNAPLVRASGTKCMKCNSSNHFTPSQIELFAFGLYPHLCRGCNELKVNSKYPAILGYIMGGL